MARRIPDKPTEQGELESIFRARNVVVAMKVGPPVERFHVACCSTPDVRYFNLDQRREQPEAVRDVHQPEWPQGHGEEALAGRVKAGEWLIRFVGKDKRPLPWHGRRANHGPDTVRNIGRSMSTEILLKLFDVPESVLADKQGIVAERPRVFHAVAVSASDKITVQNPDGLYDSEDGDWLLMEYDLATEKLSGPFTLTDAVLWKYGFKPTS